MSEIRSAQAETDPLRKIYLCSSFRGSGVMANRLKKRHLKKEYAKNNRSETEIKMISVLANRSHLSTYQR